MYEDQDNPTPEEIMLGCFVWLIAALVVGSIAWWIL